MRKSTSAFIGIGFGLGVALVLSGATAVAQRGAEGIGTTAATVARCTSIASLSGASAKATDPSNNQGIQFKVPTTAAAKPLVGQRVCLYQGTGRTLAGATVAAKAAVNSAVFVQWPAEAHKKDTVSVGHMESWVKLSNTGRIDGTTRTWTNNNAQGFTGGVKVQLQDKDGNVLAWDMPVQKYGVNANNPVSNASAPSERKADWNFPVPTEILKQVSRVRIIHRHTPEGRWDQSIEMAKELGEVLKTYAEIYTTVSGGGQ